MDTSAASVATVATTARNLRAHQMLPLHYLIALGARNHHLRALTDVLLPVLAFVRHPAVMFALHLLFRALPFMVGCILPIQQLVAEEALNFRFGAVFVVGQCVDHGQLSGAVERAFDLFLQLMALTAFTVDHLLVAHLVLAAVANDALLTDQLTQLSAHLTSPRRAFTIRTFGRTASSVAPLAIFGPQFHTCLAE